MLSVNIVAVTAGAVLAAGIASAPASATPAEGDAERTNLAEGTSNVPVWIVTQGQDTTLYVDKVVLQPGASSGWHSHPGPEYTVVNRGNVHLQTATNCIPGVFTAGQSVFIPGTVAHDVVNLGPDEAEVVVTYTLPAGLPVREDRPDACPQ